MNRVRQYDNKFQVLITPHHIYHSGFELMLGNWTDAHLKNYRIDTFNSWEEAIEKAYQFPDINWDQMVLWHKDIFSKLYGIIKYEININNFNVEFEPKLLNSYQLKDVMFNRIMIFGERFRLGYHMNDIISFHIINPFTSNLEELAEIFSVNQALRIVYKTNDKGIIRLVGKTDIGTFYEIVLWPTIISHWAKWAYANPNVPEIIKVKQLEKTVEKQRKMDNSDIHYR